MLAAERAWPDGGAAPAAAPSCPTRPAEPARRRRWRGAGLCALTMLALGGCSVVPRPAAAPGLTAQAPGAWQAPLPHGGDLVQLGRWWQQFDDPLLTALIGEAQARSATVASATARIAQARATRTAAGAALGPLADASVAATRARQDLSVPAGTSLSAGVQASWELDLFGGQAAGRDAAQARLDAARAGWHDARVAVAAEVASSYVALRACEAQVAQAERDAASRAETARLADLSAKAGFQAPADAALSRGSAAQARATLAAQRASCTIELKGLVAATGLAEPALRTQLAATRAQVPQPRPGSPFARADASARVPAQALAQRPDLLTAEYEVSAASAEVGQSAAQSLPRITLAGSIGAARFSSGALSVDGSVWSLGPLQLTLPLFDGGTRRANLAAARARYDEAVVVYAARLRNAVREVEEALVRLQATSDRAPDTQAAADGFDAAFRAAEARYKGGLASLFELEDARRNAVQAQSALIELQRERAAAWVQLYRALGGGWDAADLQARAGSVPVDRRAAPSS